MTGASGLQAVFEVSRRPMWRIRLRRELPRWALTAAAVTGLLASARMTVDPPRPVARPESVAPAVVDRAAEAYAVLFVRRYLTWSAAEPQASARALEAFEGQGMEDAGLLLPDSGQERVEWAEVVQSRMPATGEHVYTVAVTTIPGGLQYMTVSVRREPSGSLRLVGYPAFVGAPATVPARLTASTPPVTEQALETVVKRALGNYLTDSVNELSADLSAGAQIVPPASPLQPVSIARPTWAPGGGAVEVVVQALDALGVRCTLQYEMDVSRLQGRWEVSAIQTDPEGA
jgi:hypothetical protein